MKAVNPFGDSFKCICIIIAFSMGGYWVHKYLKNEDVTLIKYIAYKDSDSVHLPSMTICFSNAFPPGNTSDSNSEKYLKYLQGNTDFDDDYWSSLFDQKPWNISYYINEIAVYHFLKDEYHAGPMEIFSNLYDCPFITFENNFNGFVHGNSDRCFELKVKEKYSRYVDFVMIGFKKTFEDLVRRTQSYVRFSYPGQLLLDFAADDYIWNNKSDMNTTVAFKLDSTEVLKRRNKANDKCLEDSIHHDVLWLKHVIKKNGCKAPYHKLQVDEPICDDFDKLAVFDLFVFLHEEFTRPCEEIPHVSLKSVRYDSNYKPGLYSFVVGYPKKIKMITQQQAIDVHALIGNIGGYIGLFLGKNIFISGKEKEFKVLPWNIPH